LIEQGLTSPPTK